MQTTIDYLIADRTLIPEDNTTIIIQKKLFICLIAIKLMYLKASVSERLSLLRVMNLGYPDTGFVFFVVLIVIIKSHPLPLTGWMRILAEVDDGSVCGNVMQNNKDTAQIT